jgi:hypothetical protein
MQHDTFKVSNGRCEVACKWVVGALNNVGNQLIHWPSIEERKQVAKRVEKEFRVPNCQLIQDGTLLCHIIEPDRYDDADYHGRKFTYQ